ncbi:synaptic vesicle 2-related protein-like [Orbicella faveolata]|uniref:synaptic vesicle 2-related protein-like n=1 Tax=Orbicella faveolata TaxID=48498 RepID=UPI0009E20330|nr:synaptic vesicle 2-related protein-like [Orbicella faveolata]
MGTPDDKLGLTAEEDDPGVTISQNSEQESKATYTVEEAIDKIGYGPFQVKLMVVIGLAWMADSMEVTILAIVCPAIRCEWNLATWQEATVTTAVFAGMTISTCIWGYVSDNFGRKIEVLACTVVIFVGALLSAFAPNYFWIMVFSTVVGLGMGGVAQCMNLWAEFLPSKGRGVSLNALSVNTPQCFALLSVAYSLVWRQTELEAWLVFESNIYVLLKAIILLFSLQLSWSLGSCLEILVALVVMPTLGWRWLFFISSLPLFIFICCSKLVPESPRFYMTAGKPEKALCILQRIAKENKKELPPGQLVVTEKHEISRGRITHLFSPEFRRSTILLWIIWFSSHFVIYGIALITTEMFSRTDPCRGINPEGASTTNTSDNASPEATPCKQLDYQDYANYFIVMSGDLLGLVFIFFMVDKIGRKMVQFAAFLGSAIFLTALFICTRSRLSTTLFLYGSRLFISIADMCGYVYTPEVYPTNMRGIGLGACSGAARIGCMITPFVAMVLMPHSILLSLSLYSGFSVLGIVTVLLLPIETKGRALQVSRTTVQYCIFPLWLLIFHYVKLKV